MKPLEDLVKKIGGWPMISGESWDESKWNWDDAMKALVNVYKIEDIYKGAIDTDNEISRDSGIASEESSLNVEKLRALLTDVVLEGFRADVNKAQLEEEIHDVFKFEKDLVRYTKKLIIFKTNFKFNSGTKKKLSKYREKLNWLSFFHPSDLFKDVNIDKEEVKSDLDINFLEFLQSTRNRWLKPCLTSSMLSKCKF